MGSLGLVLFLGILLLIGAAVALIHSIFIYSSTKQAVHGFCIAGIHIMSTCLFIFGFVALSFGSGAGDWDTGAFDYYRTPLGGGFAVSSVDGYYELPISLDISETSTVSPTPRDQLAVDKLACVNKNVILDLDGRYGVIDSDARRLTVFASYANLRSAFPEVGSTIEWLSRERFTDTPCSDPPRASDIVQGVLSFLPMLLAFAGFVFAIILGEKLKLKSQRSQVT